MSRSPRRTASKDPRERKKAARKKSSQRRRKIPVLPIVLIAGVLAVVAVIVVAILQNNSKGGSGDAVAAEANDDTTLPGQYVNLPSIYDGPYGSPAGGTGGHVREDVDYVAKGNTNPPAGGPHWSGGCGEDPSTAPEFCGPAPWGIYRKPWQPETLVHNMEHGGVIIWYNTSNQKTIADLESLATSKLKKGKHLVLAPYPDMEQEIIALTSWSRIDKFPVAQYSKDRVENFIDVHERRFNPEHF